MIANKTYLQYSLLTPDRYSINESCSACKQPLATADKSEPIYAHISHTPGELIHKIHRICLDNQSKHIRPSCPLCKKRIIRILDKWLPLPPEVLVPICASLSKEDRPALMAAQSSTHQLEFIEQTLRANPDNALIHLFPMLQLLPNAVQDQLVTEAIKCSKHSCLVLLLQNRTPFSLSEKIKALQQAINQSISTGDLSICRLILDCQPPLEDQHRCQLVLYFLHSFYKNQPSPKEISVQTLSLGLQLLMPVPGLLSAQQAAKALIKLHVDHPEALTIEIVHYLLPGKETLKKEDLLRLLHLSLQHEQQDTIFPLLLRHPTSLSEEDKLLLIVDNIESCIDSVVFKLINPSSCTYRGFLFWLSAHKLIDAKENEQLMNNFKKCNWPILLQEKLFAAAITAGDQQIVATLFPLLADRSAPALNNRLKYALEHEKEEIALWLKEQGAHWDFTELSEQEQKAWIRATLIARNPLILAQLLATSPEPPDSYAQSLHQILMEEHNCGLPIGHCLGSIHF